MTKDIEPRLKLISEYLKTGQQELFVIPEYQREYSWGKDQCDKLWQDIEAYIESDVAGDTGKKDPYFFGTIIVDCSQPGKFSLIDGQQRTTTFILLLKALLIRIQELLEQIKPDDENRKLRSGLQGKRNKIIDILYKTDDESRIDILEDWNYARGIAILENYSISETAEFKNDLKRIVEAKDFGEAQYTCHQIKYRRGDNRWTNFFKNFRNFYENLSQYTESKVNSFAKTVLEECQVIEIRSWQTEQAITMFNSLNSTGLELTDANIISAQMYSNAGEERRNAFNDKWQSLKRTTAFLESKDVLKIDAVLQQYMYIQRVKDGKTTSDTGATIVNTPGLRKYYTFDNPSLLKRPLELCENFCKIANIWEKIHEYPIVRYLVMRFNSNIRLFLICYLYRFSLEEIDESKVTEIAEPLLRLFALLELVEAGYSSSNFKIFLFTENIKIVDERISISEIENDFTRHIRERWNREDIRQRLEDYDKNVLVYLNDYLYAKAHGDSLPWKASVNVEHIMPASGKDIVSIRQDANLENDEEFKQIVNKLGNKVLLEEDINKGISNEWFKTKKQSSITEKRGYKDSLYPLAHSLQEYPHDVWTKEDINLATQKAVNRILNFIFGNDDND